MTPATDLTSTFIGNFRRVDTGLFAGAQPVIPQGIKELCDIYHIKTVVDLQAENALEASESLACSQLGVPFYSIPLPGVEIFCELPEAQVRKVLAVIDNPSNWPIFLHCKHGADRTGAIVGIHRIDSGWSLQDALAEMKRYHNSWLEFGMRDTVEDYLKARIKGMV